MQQGHTLFKTGTHFCLAGDGKGNFAQTGRSRWADRRLRNAWENRR